MKNILPLALLLLSAANVEAATVAPHRAIYELTLLRANDGASLQSADGRLAFEIQGSKCEGYSVSFRMATKYRPKDGDPTVIDTQTISYEGPGALDFRHQLKEIINGETKQDIKIKVTRSGEQSEGQGELSPKGESFTVPVQTALPMQHQLKLMTLGETGGGRDSSLVYDGSDETKSFRAISFVGKEKPPGSVGRDSDDPVAAPLKSIGAWPMSISYYAAEGSSETPEYQVTFDMYENGVATGLKLDYGEFVLAGKLKELTMLDVPECP